MAIIAPGICRYVVHGRYGGQEMLNIIDMQIDTTGEIVGRHDAISTVAGDIINNWSDHILEIVSSSYTVETLTWVDLDEADGETGIRTSTDGSSWPLPGGQSADGFPGNTYLKVTKVLEGKNRQQRNGTLRLGAIPEGATSPGSPNVVNDPGYLSLVQPALDDFLDGINDQGVFEFSRQMVVVHTVNDVFTSYSGVASLLSTNRLGTLSRRMPGYGS